FAQFRAQSSGGEVEDWLEEGKPRHRLFDPKKLEQLDFRIAETYDYTSSDGQLLYQVLRWHHRIIKTEKKFSMRRPTGDAILEPWFADGGEVKVIYRWPDVVARPDEDVFCVEGEKDANRLHKEGLLATTVAGQHWSETAAEALRGRNVIIPADNDEAGRA